MAPAIPGSGFGLAAAITILLNTALAWAKDASPALLNFMNAVALHNWIAQGLVDILCFLGLGVVFSKTGIASGMPSNRLVLLVIAAVLVGALGLFFWYICF
jgi:hypothetical protein